MSNREELSRTPSPAAAAEILLQADRDWEYLSDEEKRGTVDEALNALIGTEELELESELTDTKYRVSKWIYHGDGNYTALEKKEIRDADE